MPKGDMLPSLAVTLQLGRYGGPSSASEQNNMRIDYQAALELLHHQEALESSLSALAHQYASLNNDEKILQQALLDTARTSIAFLRQHVDRLFNVIPLSEHPPTAESAAKAQKVFSTPELLENILLSGLATPEKLKAMTVQRCFRDTVLGSPRLKRSLGLAVAPVGSFYYSPWSDANARFCKDETFCKTFNDGLHYHLPGGAIMFEDFPKYPKDPEAVEVSEDDISGFIHNALRDDYDPENHDAEVTLNIYFEPWNSLDCGKRVDSMALCSPPMLSIRLGAQCTRCERNVGTINKDTLEASSPLGLTFGEIADKACEIRALYPLCGVCRLPAVVRFRGSVDLQVSEPRVGQPSGSEQRAAAQTDAEWDARRTRHREWVAARQKNLEIRAEAGHVRESVARKDRGRIAPDELRDRLCAIKAHRDSYNYNNHSLKAKYKPWSFRRIEAASDAEPDSELWIWTDPDERYNFPARRVLDCGQWKKRQSYEEEDYDTYE